MSVGVVALVALALLLALLAIGVPVPFSLALAGAIGIFLIEGESVATATLGRTPYTSVAAHSLAVIPLFIAMGLFAQHSNMGSRVFGFISVTFQRVPGGVLIASIFACAAFGAVSGSSIAALAAIGPLAISEMTKQGYRETTASGVLAAAGTLGILIPPSIALVIYAIVAQESVKWVLMAGIVPGIVSASIYVLLAAMIGRRAARRGQLPSREPAGKGGVHRSVEGKKQIVATTQVFVIFSVVMGGMYAGIFTVNESAGVGALLTLMILLWNGRKSGLKTVASQVQCTVQETVNLSSMILLLVVGAGIFSFFLIVGGLPRDLASGITAMSVPTWLLVALLLGVLIPLGMFLDGISMMLITVPLLHPIFVGELGYDGLWLAVVMIKTIELGLITPPVGINAYVISGLSGGSVTAESVFRGVIPFYVADAVTIVILVLFPGIVTWLPDLMGR